MAQHAPKPHPVRIIIVLLAFTLFFVAPMVLVLLAAIGMKVAAIDEFIEKNHIGLGMAFMGLMILTYIGFKVLQRRNNRG